MPRTPRLLLIVFALVGCASSGPAPSVASEPQVRLGRWNTTFSTSGGVGTTTVQCVREADLIELLGNLPAECSPANRLQRDGDQWVMDAECSGDRDLNHVRVTVTGDLQTHFAADTTLTGRGVSSSIRTTHVEASYAGACRGNE